MTGPTPDTCNELLEPLRALVGLKHVTVQRGRFARQTLPYAVSGLLGELVCRGETRASDLAARLVIDASVVSRQVAQLEHAGLITRRPDQADGRVSLLRATPEGERVFAQLQREKAEWLSRALENWRDDEVRELAALLSTIETDIRRYAVDAHESLAEGSR